MTAEQHGLAFREPYRRMHLSHDDLLTLSQCLEIALNAKQTTLDQLVRTLNARMAGPKQSAYLAANAQRLRDSIKHTQELLTRVKEKLSCVN